jgi:hypothetical protein
MTEKQQAFDLANAVLDKPYEDPDSDIAVLARQFLRAREEIDAMREALERIDVIIETGKVNHAKVAQKVARGVLVNFTVPEVPRK